MRPLQLTTNGLVVAGLVFIGLVLIAISIPPLFNPIFGEEPRMWSPLSVVNGALYLAAAALVGILRSRVGAGLALVLGMLGFSLSFGWMMSRFEFVGFPIGEVVITGLLATAHATVVIGVLHGAARWSGVAQPDARRSAAAAVLAGVGLVLAMGPVGGQFGITLTPIQMPRVYVALEYTIAIPHFVAVAALALHGRLATIGSLALTAAGVVLSVRVLVALLEFEGGVRFILDGVAIWAFLLVAYLVAGLLLVATLWSHFRGAAATSKAAAGR